ncbi:tetratricopeptide repeat protein [Undibacterium sp. TS12]|uniref:tetratricopeptide repeat protein n=1 Tax=Undibacterium sp. TS12 TaxID=2908202 RepID=UPI001F4C8829|nr:tetratricopeptide repeat protein [Undibacterium sp. TS12]MCH8622092.1 sel1 repeat family protein [Undibacterium sp. TS12]
MRNISHYVMTLPLIVGLPFATNTVRADDFNNGVNYYAQGDFASALDSFKNAAEKGNADAQFNLGLMYLNGEGVVQDYKQAMKWFEQSASQGNVRAQVNIGRMYAKGKGVLSNHGVAASWFKKAAEQGYADAQYSLGILYVTGTGVARDYGRAKELFQQAANQGNASGQYQLGLIYLKGRGVAINLVTAYKWLILAGDYDDSAIFRKFVEAKMSKEEISEAQALAQEWKPEKTAE